MGSSPRANLAYGYDLGYIEDFRAAERDECGGPNLPWFGDDGGSWDFGAQVEAKLAEAGIRGVQLEFSGGGELPGWVLVADDSKRSVAWSEAMVLDLAKLEHPPTEWFDWLTAAIEALNITPTQDWPRWLVFPSYG